MKRLLTLLLVLLLPLCALAEVDEDGDVVVTLPDAEFFFTPPEDTYLLTRESSASVFNALGLSQREMLPYMEDYDLYAILFDEEITWEMHVQAYAYDAGDYDDLTEYGAQLECENMRYYYKDQGYDVLSCEVYRAPEGHTFVCVRASYTYEDGVTEQQVEFLTVQGGCAVSIYLFSYLGELTEEQFAVAEAVADSLWILSAQ